MAAAPERSASGNQCERTANSYRAGISMNWEPSARHRGGNARKLREFAATQRGKCGRSSCLRHPVLLAPGEEFRNRAAISAARVRVADVGNEEFPKARLRALAGGRHKGWGAVSDDGDERARV
jgi:hypothetical protein